MLKVKQFVFNPFGVNTFVISDSDTSEAIVIDPGMTSAHEQKLFDDYMAANNLRITQIVNTHLHLDHCFGDNYVRNKYGVTVAAHADDAPLGASLQRQAAQFGMMWPDDAPVSIDVPLSDGDKITLGAYSFTVLHVPGHSPGGIALYCPEGKLAIVGDSIFHGAIGRTDLPGGDHATLIASLKNKILTMPDDTNLLPGHDQFTTVAQEKAHNPFIR